MISPFFFYFSLIFHEVTRFTRAMVCINVWSFIGLSRYRVATVHLLPQVGSLPHEPSGSLQCWGGARASNAGPCPTPPSRPHPSMNGGHAGWWTNRAGHNVINPYDALTKIR